MNDFINEYFQSKEYLNTEMSDTYLQLRKLLEYNLPIAIFLDCEELLHETIIQKIIDAIEYTITNKENL